VFEIQILAIISLIYICLLSSVTLINFFYPKNIITKYIHKKFDMNYRSVLMYCLILSTIGTVSSLYLSEIKNLEPCKYCWFERIFLFPLVIIYFMSWIKKDPNGIIISIPFILIGILISLFHYSIQLFPLEESCEIINCSSPYVWELGFISIPLMAFFNFFGLLLIIINFKILSK